MSPEVWNVVATVSQVISSIVAVIGIVYIAIQVRDTKRSTRAQTMNELEKESREHKAALQLVTGKWKRTESIVPDEDELYELFACLGWFERIKILLDNKVIDMRTANELFAYRFFLVVNNHNVQQYILYPDQESFISIFALHADWRRYRRDRSQIIYRNETDLAKFDKTQYQRLLNNYASHE